MCTVFQKATLVGQREKMLHSRWSSLKTSRGTGIPLSAQRFCMMLGLTRSPEFTPQLLHSMLLLGAKCCCVPRFP